MFGAIEAGGTKFVCAVGDANGQITERIQVPTTVPEETMDKVLEFFKQYSVDVIGVGSFGPVDVNQDSPTYGYITSTPKKRMDKLPICTNIEGCFFCAGWF